ncbi:MAG TPA: 3-deoxy-7-phosphoheptulonate synthase, partial [Alcanivorax sp.]|nr:3-deoxy-7-phosphoheptulonate synthase [Alcanivorax sp.]HCJ63219.1 3-deoxy-7-phosphoheptulonate synthase [Alcanivorax sp.]HCM67371.1 3-deoxy-7-phosphoheptulonate synthase [Alcanivorax sp.]
MSQKQLDDLNIESQEVLITPRALKEKLPLSEAAAETVFQGRQQIRDILDRKDPRLFVVIGPCSIHDPKAAMEYAERLKKLAAEVDDALFLV